MNKKIKEEEVVLSWIEKINRAERIYEPYHNLIKNIREYYRGDVKSDKQNIFWSTIETLKPFLYFKQPKPYIEQKEKSADKVCSMATRILEKALKNNLQEVDFDSIIKYARNDFLLAGTGIVIERYKPEFGIIKDEAGKNLEIKIDEKVESEYVNPINFIADVDKVGIWEECCWIGIKQYMSSKDVIKNFGEEFALIFQDDEDKVISVYEIWDKQGEKVFYIAKEITNKFLKVIEGGLKLNNFYPMPKPVFATLTNDSIIPVPDYVQIKPLLDELDGVTNRMEKTMKAIKVSGCYDNAFPELANILNKDITLVGLADFDRLKAAGGISNIVDFMPIGQYVEALKTLALRRQDLIEAIYEVTGVSDIMRGVSSGNDTATAVIKKTNFGTLRNQDRQNDMQRFIAELFKIKAEIICEQFDRDKLLSYLPKEERNLPEAVIAVELLKKDKLRGLVLGVESDLSFNQGEEIKKNIEAVTTMHNIIGQAFDTVSKQPILIRLYRQMISSVVAVMPNARQYEGVIESCFDDIIKEFETVDVMPNENQIDLPREALAVQKQKNIWDYEIKKEQNRLKSTELLLKFENEQKDRDLAEKKLIPDKI